jgi:hypothetical protein
MLIRRHGVNKLRSARRVDVNAVDSQGVSPLYVAAQNGYNGTDIWLCACVRVCVRACA